VARHHQNSFGQAKVAERQDDPGFIGHCCGIREECEYKIGCGGAPCVPGTAARTRKVRKRAINPKAEKPGRREVGIGVRASVIV